MGDHLVPGTWQYDDANRLLQRGTVSYQYDPAGNLVRKVDTALPEPRRTTHFAYDGFNRLVEVRDGSDQVVSRYAYDPFGYRISKEVTAAGAAHSGATAGKRLFLQAEEGLLAEVGAGGQWQQSYGWKPENTYSTSPLFLRSGSGYFYYQNDPLGQPRQLLDKAGALVWQASRISAFGSVVVEPGSSTEQPWRFPGQYSDLETGLHYNVHRYYDAESGRYVTADPIGLEGGFNRYAYAMGNPLLYTDPLGLMTDCQKNAIANGIAQGLPLIGLGLIASDNNFTPFGGGPWLTPSPATRLDQVSGVASTVAGAVDSPLGEAVAQDIIDSQFRDHKTGNRAERKVKRNMKREVVWKGARQAARFAGTALNVIGWVSAAAQAYEDWQDCEC